MNSLYELKRPGVFAIENVGEKWVFLSYSKDVLSYVSRLVSGSEKYRNCEVRFLEDWYDPVESQLVLRLWYSDYRNKGWRIVNYNPRLLEYKVRIRMLPEFKVGVYVYSKTRSYLCGSFDTRAEAENLVAKIKAMRYVKPIYEDGFP